MRESAVEVPLGVELGIIEGFYGRPWSWEQRLETMRFLAPHGYHFYHYCPKADTRLRRRWKELHSGEETAELSRLASACREAGVRFGVGISPLEILDDFQGETREALGRKVEFFDELGVQDLAILFDDISVEFSDLAERQVEIVHWVAGRTAAARVLICPTYYSDDPVLDRVFKARPPKYLETLGELLEPEIEIYWTGEEVCSRELSPGHLRRVGEQLGREPFLWDNYPVNDGQRMSQYLHIRGFTGRPAELGAYVSAHGINPALQPVLTRIPALTLVESYRAGEEYEYGEAFARAAVEVLGPELGEALRGDLLALQEVGLDQLGKREPELRERYSAYDHPGAREIMDWLDGGYRITQEIVETQ